MYWNTALETWRLPSGGAFSVALTPVVIDELDRHKADGSNRPRQAKAARLIRQIGEYRSRGILVDGVPLSKTSRIFAKFLPWLTGWSADDYFFASALAVMRLNPRAPTAIITRDVNLHNKIEFARLSFWSPEVIVEEARK